MKILSAVPPFVYLSSVTINSLNCQNNKLASKLVGCGYGETSVAWGVLTFREPVGVYSNNTVLELF